MNEIILKALQYYQIFSVNEQLSTGIICIILFPLLFSNLILYLVTYSVCAKMQSQLYNNYSFTKGGMSNGWGEGNFPAFIFKNPFKDYSTAISPFAKFDPGVFCSILPSHSHKHIPHVIININCDHKYKVHFENSCG